MKNISRVLIVLALLFPLSLAVFADFTEARAALQRALDKLETYGYHLPDGGLGSAWWVWNMNPGYYNQVNRTFYAGNSYALVAAGDSRVSDVDLKVYDENWNLIDSDDDSSSVAIVTFTPRWTGVFHVRTIYYSGASVGSVGFFIGYRR
jgi:hypothetical protein